MACDFYIKTPLVYQPHVQLLQPDDLMQQRKSADHLKGRVPEVYRNETSGQ